MIKQQLLYPCLISLVTIIFAIVTFGYIPPEVPLLYGNIQGQDQLIPKLALLLAPLSAILISIANFFIAKKIGDTLYQKSLIYTSYLINIMVAITVFKVIFLVGYF